MSRRAKTRAPKMHSGQGGFTLIELIVVIILLGVLAAVIVPRYADMTTQATQGAAEGAWAEGYNRLRLATAAYITEHQGAEPTALSDLSPRHLNATSNLGDYTAAYTQGSGQITVDIYPGSTSTGTPLFSRAVNWP